MLACIYEILNSSYFPAQRNVSQAGVRTSETKISSKADIFVGSGVVWVARGIEKRRRVFQLGIHWNAFSVDYERRRSREPYLSWEIRASE